MSLEAGTAIQCACCFDDVATDECVPCKQNGVSGAFFLSLWLSICR
jgi:hypothetical protein